MQGIPAYEPKKYDGNFATNGQECPYMPCCRPNNGKIRASLPELKIEFENYVKIEEIRKFIKNRN
jgi:hypothetical protein